MEFNGTLIITDPCYFSKDEDWGKENRFDYYNYKINPSIGFSNYLWDSTGYGDGRWKVSEMIDKIMSRNELEEFVEKIEGAYYDFFTQSGVESQIKLEELIQKRNTIGRYCVDSGTYGIFYLDEVLKYYPGFLTEYGEWCYTIIQDFIGDVDIYKDSRGQSHILGTGNKSFYSNTVSWL